MADDRKITIEIEAKDYASSVFRTVTSGVRTFAIQANNGIYRANNTLRMYNNTMRGFNSTVTRALADAGRAIYNFTTDAIKQFAALEQQHAKTMGAMSSNYNFNNPQEYAQFQSMSSALMNQAIQLAYTGVTGNGSLHSPQEIAQAQTALQKAGVSENDILYTSALPNVLKFAGANDLDVDTATEFAVQVGTQFNYTPDQWGDMLDEITYAANASIIDVEDIIESMKYAGNMASGYDQPLSDVLAAIAVMGQSGLRGSQAGTGIQAIFTRGMSTTGVSTAGKPPTQNVEDIYNGFASQVVDEDGNFLGLGNFVDILDETTSGLSDQEMSWFYKKLFGMFQQKAGLALTGGDNMEGEMTYDDYVDAIVANAAGTNDKIYELALETTYGNLESVENAWLAFKTEFGKDLSPLTIGVAQQLRTALLERDFDFDTDIFRQKVEEAGALLAEDFSQDVADAFMSVGNFLADAIDVGLAETPLITGSASALLKLLNGDFEGGWQAFKDGIEGVNKNIDDLPPELQDTATAIRNLILIFEGLFALNIVTRVAEGVTSFIRLFTGNKILSAGAKVASATSTISAGAVTTMTVGSVANATVASMMANTTTMTVYASIVNVIGGSGLGSGGGSGLGGGSPVGGGTPLLPSGGASALLPSIATGAAGLGTGFALKGTSQGLLGAGSFASSGKWLPGATSQVLNADGSVAATYFGKSGISMAGIASKALKVLGTAGMVIGIMDMLTIDAGINNSPESMYQAYLDAYDAGNRSDADIKNYMVNKDAKFIEGGEAPDGSWFSIDEFISFLKNSSAFTTSGSGMQELYDAFTTQINNGGNIDEKFLNEFFDSRGIDRGYGQGFLEQMLNSMFNDTYTTPKTYAGEYANKSVDEFVRANMDNTQDWSQYGTIAQVLAALNGTLEGMTYVNDTDNVYKDGNGDYYQLLADGTLKNISDSMTTASISLSDAVSMLTQNPSFNLGLNQGPLSQQGAYDYIMGPLGSASGIAANQGLLEQINSGIAALDPTLTVDITNPNPVVNVDVNVHVDQNGNVSKNVIQSFGGIDNWVFRESQRYGSSTTVR